ncbi:MAG: hypothetical protein AVDCRST_MAG73-882, partial [uncultured Thermomicrobiales bacterium]
HPAPHLAPRGRPPGPRRRRRPYAWLIPPAAPGWTRTRPQPPSTSPTSGSAITRPTRSTTPTTPPISITWNKRRSTTPPRPASAPRCCASGAASSSPAATRSTISAPPSPATGCASPPGPSASAAPAPTAPTSYRAWDRRSFRPASPPRRFRPRTASMPQPTPPVPAARSWSAPAPSGRSWTSRRVARVAFRRICTARSSGHGRRRRRGHLASAPVPVV